MASDLSYYPRSGLYWETPNTIYAQYRGGDCPNPCRKYHVSSALDGAEHVSALVLPYLAERKLFHKVVRSRSCLTRQSAGDQAGKFITIYMPAYVAHKNRVISALGAMLATLQGSGRARPSPTVPKSRAYSHVFIEQPLAEAMFTYGGFVCDPSE